VSQLSPCLMATISPPGVYHLGFFDEMASRGRREI
jgi:hypothetical protein